MQSSVLQVRRFHWIATLLLILCLVPAFFILNLPFRFAWNGFLSQFGGIGLQSIVLAAALYLIGFPLERSLLPLWQHYWSQKPRFLALGLFVSLMVWQLGWTAAIILSVLTIILLELVDRSKSDVSVLAAWMGRIFAPAVYLFAGFVLVFSYNDIIAAARYTGAYDPVFLKMDSWILGAASISQIAHDLLKQLSPGMFAFLEFIYYRMFPQIGAALLITGLYYGRREAFRFASTILTSYYLALIAFALWPSFGPFFSCAIHFSEFPRSLTYSIQTSLLAKAQLLWQHKPVSVIDTDFYIAFPCMHIAQPIIVLWFLRRWRRIAFCLLIYDIVLIPAILILEWHYVIDLLGGIVVAILAIALNPNRGGELSPEDVGRESISIDRPHSLQGV
jgi:hypothetical protein